MFCVGSISKHIHPSTYMYVPQTYQVLHTFAPTYVHTYVCVFMHVHVCIVLCLYTRVYIKKYSILANTPLDTHHYPLQTTPLHSMNCPMLTLQGVCFQELHWDSKLGVKLRVQTTSSSARGSQFSMFSGDTVGPQKQLCSTTANVKVQETSKQIELCRHPYVS